MKKGIRVLAIVSLLIFVSCAGERINQEQTTEMLLGYENGIIAGIGIGDNWDDIKKNHHESWTVREEHTIEEYDGNKIEYNINQLNVPIDHYPLMMAVSFELNSDNNIETFDFFIKGKAEDKLYLTQLKKDIQNEFNNKFSFLKEGEWLYNTPNGEERILSLVEYEFEENELQLDISFL